VTIHSLQPNAAGVFFHRFCILAFSSVFLLVIVSSLPLSANPNAAHPVKGEDAYALIFGTVWGPDSRPEYGVKVAIRRAEEKKAHWHLLSDHNGEFAQRVPAGKGNYVIWVESAPWKQSKLHKQKGLEEWSRVKLHVENDERTDISLHLTE
jgi:hypothetical protein